MCHRLTQTFVRQDMEELNQTLNVVSMSSSDMFRVIFVSLLRKSYLSMTFAL